MKKMTFVCFIILSSVGMKIYAIELWNGFTTDMTVSQVVTHARRVLSTSDVDLNYNYSEDNITFGFTSRYGIEIKEKLPVYESCIAFKTTLPAYDQMWDKNVIFFFIKGKLFAIQIKWTASGDDLLEATKKQYGNYNYTVVDDLFSYYNWRINGKLIYVRYGTASASISGGDLCIIDLQIVENFMAEQKLQQEIKRRQAFEGITF